MKLGLHVGTKGDFYGIPKRARAAGGEVAQFFAGNPRGWRQKEYTEEEGDKFQEACNEHDIETFIHMLYLTSYGSPNKELRNKSINAYRDMLATSDRLGSIGVVTHLGSHKGAGFENQLPSLASGLLESLDQEPRSYAILENSAGAGNLIGNSIDELAAIYEATDRHPKIKFCLDTAHLFAAGFDIRTKEGVDRVLDEFDKKIGLEHLVVFHLNDSKVEFDTNKDRHENIGDGFIGNDCFRALVNHPRLKEIPGILEVPGLDGNGPDKANVDRLQKLVND